MFNIFFFENHIYELMCKIIAEPEWSQMTIWCMRIACWIPRAAKTHSEYVMLIYFPLQQVLHERASMSRHTFIACLVTC